MALAVGSIEETVTVTGATPVVDIQNVRGQTTLTAEVLKTVPGSTNSQGLAKLTLGVTMEGPLGGGDSGGSKGEPVFGFNSVHGSPTGTTMIDGMKTSSAYRVATAHRYLFNARAAAEIVMETSGGDAESESAGVNVNMIPREGGNFFSGNAVVEFTNESLQAEDNLNDSLRDRFVTATNTTEHVYDVGIGLGGPIVENKLWFYGAFRDWGARETLAGVFRNAIPETLFYEAAAEHGAYDRQQRDGSLRLTWQATESQKLSLSSGVQTYNWLGAFFQFNPEGHWDFLVYPNNNHMVRWTYAQSNSVLVEAGVSLRQDRQKNGLPFPNSPGTRRSINDRAVGTYGSRLNSPTGDTDYGDVGNQYAYQMQASVSYITGSHALKVGFMSMTGQHEARHIEGVFSEQYQFNNRVPIGIKQAAYPHAQLSKLKYNLGIYAQDTWTIDRLTLNLGVRLDFLNGYNPAQTRPGGLYTPAINFPEYKNVPNWKDISPRLGVAYDLFGDGRTALKAQYGRYVIYDTLGLTSRQNGASSISSLANRTWADANGDYVPDCDLTLNGANGECGALDNAAFGSSIPVQTYSKDVTEGWGVRPFNDTLSLILQQELTSGIGVEVGYFRTTYGNHSLIDNLATGSGDYDEFCVMQPTASNLPGGGGNEICNLWDVTPAKFGMVDNLVIPAAGSGGHTNISNFVDVKVNARFGNGGLLFGGLSTGTIHIDTCNHPDFPGANNGTATGGFAGVLNYCNTTRPWAGNTQIKFGGSYPIWKGIAASATWQNLPGLPAGRSGLDGQTTLLYTSSQIEPSLGRPTSGGLPRVLTIVEPYTYFEDRYNVLDLRISYALAVGNTTVKPTFDIFNLTNSGTPAFVFGNYNPYAWPYPFEISTPRLFKFGVQVDF